MTSAPVSSNFVQLHADGKTRCLWPGMDPFYVAYHDDEWGVPEYDSRALFEKLILDGFQAGLSWITILRKREGFHRAFANFDPEIIARFDEAKIEELMQDTGIVRNRAKITGTIVSARIYLNMQERGSFSDFIWKFVDGRPRINQFRNREDVPAQTEQSLAMSKELKKAGFKFCGPTITYAFMQAVGMVNDHMVDCCCHAKCAALALRS
ncbi:DNA-3-methyladenine glycosylase I [Pseudochelatococcus sp. G4_1912]|uniref:DNA-3-methyladenine glycosylase I n=1 Tax=Pseudochelatococcus sp. G4_1912 TaxID=3114288 RepID=UPI0039C68484